LKFLYNKPGLLPEAAIDFKLGICAQGIEIALQ